MITYQNGDLTEHKAQVLAHQVNCRGVMCSGVAKALRAKYPEIFLPYKKLCDTQEKPGDMLGTAQLIPTRQRNIVANLFGQLNYGTHIKQTDYDALKSAFASLHNQMIQKSLTSVAIPFKIGCDLAGGDWNTVEQIVADEFKDDTNIMCFIIKL